MAQKKYYSLIILLMFSIFLLGSAIPLVSSEWTAALSNDITSYWRLDEHAASSFVQDQNGSNNGTATVNTNTWNVTGKIGTAFNIDGSGNVVGLGNPAALYPTEAITVSAWIYGTNWAGDAGFNTILGSASGLGFHVDASGYLSLYIPFTGQGFKFIQSSTTMNQNQWYLVGFTYNRTKLKLYINGSEAASADYTYTMNMNSANPTSLGDENSGNLRYFNGYLDEVGFWGRALSAAEFTQLWNGGAGITYSFATIPVVSILYPQAIIYNSSVTQLNYTVTDGSRCWYSTDGGATNSSDVAAGTNFTLTSTLGVNNWTVFCNSTTSDVANDKHIFTFQDINNPISTLNLPINNANAGAATTLNCTASDNIAVANVSLYGNWSGGWHLNSTNTSGINNTNYLFTANLPDGSYKWNCKVSDTTGNTAFDVSNFTFNVEATPPLISIIYPISTTYNSVSQLNYTYSDSNPGYCWYSKNAGVTNSTAEVAGTNFTGVTTSAGSNTWKVFCNDTIGNLNSSSITFIIDTTPPTVYSGGSGGTVPLNESYTNKSSTNFTVNASDTAGIKNITFTLKNNTGVIINETTIEPGGILEGIWGFIYNLWYEGPYTWFFTVVDTVGNVFIAGNNSITYDITPPFGNIIYPLNRTYNSSVFGMNVSIVETNPNNCWYNVGSGNISIPCGDNITDINSSDLKNGLVLYYTLNETVGSVLDSTGNYNTIEILGATRGVAGKINASFSFDGSSWVLQSSFPNMTSSMTACAWLNFTGTGASEYVLGKWADSNREQWLIILNLGTISFSINTAGGSISTNPISGYNNSNWHYVCGRANSTNIIINIDDIANVTIGSTYTGNLDSSTAPLFVGGNIYGNNYTGTIDEVGIWNRSLNDTEITVLYNSGGGSSYNNFTSRVLSSEGANTWYFWVNDSVGYVNESEVTFTIDTINPAVAITSPLNNSNNTNKYLDILYTATDANLNKCWYSLNSGISNVTLPGCLNFNLTWSEELHNVTVWANDTAGNQNSSSVIFLVDTIAPQFTFISLPNVSTAALPVNGTFLVSTFDINIATCGYYTSDNSTNITYTCNAAQNINFTTGDSKNIIIWANDTSGNYNFTTYNFYIYYITANASSTASISEGDTSYHWLYVNMTNIINYPVNPWLIWNGTNYGAGVRTNVSSNSIRFDVSLIVPNFVGIYSSNVNWTWYYNITNIANSWNVSGTQAYTAFFFGSCSATLTTKVLNITFVDETSGLPMNATIDASDWTYYYLNSTPKGFLFSNTTHNNFYEFCVFPASIPSFHSLGTIQYSNSETGTYPQRRVTLNDIYYNNSLTNRTLYLLNLNNGITSNYQVISIGNQVIAGAYITVDRTIGSSVVRIADGITDSAGSLTFFLNPNYEHTFTVSAAGFSTQIQTIKPSQASYTFTMGSGSNAFVYNESIEGITYTKWPPSGAIQDGNYNYSFEVYSRRNNIYNCSFIIRYANGSTLDSASGCNSTWPSAGNGGKIWKMINVTGITQLKGSYYITAINNSGSIVTVRIEGDANWHVIPIEKQGGIGIMSAINDTMNMNEWGTDARTTDFSKIVFFFLGLAIVLGALNFFTGYDTAYPGAFIYIVTIIVIIMSFVNGFSGPGYFFLNGASNPHLFCLSSTPCDFSRFFDNWIIAGHFVLLSIIYFFTTNKRYQSG